MKCQKCNIEFQTGQKFCGNCGHPLEKICKGCGAVNPPLHSFCGQCGQDLVELGSCLINRAGLIVESNSTFLDLLDLKSDKVLNKPFSLFVAKQDLSTFFSHWNDLISSSQHQSMEIQLQNLKNVPIYAQVQFNFDNSSSGNSNHIKMTFTDVSDRRLAKDQIQYKDNLIGLIFTIAKDLLTVSPIHRDKSIKEVLKTVCLFTKSHSCFYYHLNEEKKRLDIVCQWALPNTKTDTTQNKNISFALISQTLAKIRRERIYIAENTKKLSPARRSELTTWFNGDIGALMCHLVFFQGSPVGIIGVSKMDSSMDWQKDTIALVNLVGHLIINTISAEQNLDNVFKKGPDKFADKNKINVLEENVDIPGFEIIIDNKTLSDTSSELSIEDVPKSRGKSSPTATKKKMRFKKDAPSDDKVIERVYPREDGKIQLTCSNCGLKEIVPPNPFNEIGYTLLATCPCGHSFSIMRELRWFYRKKLHLNGFYKPLEPDKHSLKYTSKRWVPMVILDLSKSGIRFSALGNIPYQIGEKLMVKFNLDNSSQTLIKKVVTVKSVAGKTVGCQFEGTDQHDTTLGFYLL